MIYCTLNLHRITETLSTTRRMQRLLGVALVLRQALRCQGWVSPIPHHHTERMMACATRHAPHATSLFLRIDGKYVDTEGDDSNGRWWEKDDLEVLQGRGNDFDENFHEADIEGMIGTEDDIIFEDEEEDFVPRGMNRGEWWEGEDAVDKNKRPVPFDEHEHHPADYAPDMRGPEFSRMGPPPTRGRRPSRHNEDEIHPALRRDPTIRRKKPPPKQPKVRKEPRWWEGDGQGSLGKDVNDARHPIEPDFEEDFYEDEIEYMDPPQEEKAQWWSEDPGMVVQNDEEEAFDEELEWIPDRDLARMRKQIKPELAHPTAAKDILGDNYGQVEEISKTLDSTMDKEKASPYTEEEEEIIEAMGGKESFNQREQGYLGDSTLSEIARDYSITVCYLADVLCMWGVPSPIDIHARLGDLVTGEQAFAILEAVHSLDVGALNDRYSNMNLMDVCDFYEIELKAGFEFAMKEGWSLPFGVLTNLRVEQEDELLRVLRGDHYE